MPAPSHQYIEVADLTLHLKEWSTSGRLLLLMHAGLQSCDAWDQIAPHFCDRYRVVAVDLRGHNLSRGPAAGYTWTDDMAGDIIQLLPQLTDEPAVLLGHSLGAMVAVPTAAKAPAAVAAIVLEDPPITQTKTHHASPMWRRNLDYARSSLDEKTAFLMQDRGIPLHEARPHAERHHRNSPAILAEMVAGKCWYDYREWLPRVDSQIFAIFGEHGVVALDDQRRLAEDYGFARMSQWAGTGHGPHEDDPERFVREVAGFLDDCGI